MKPEALQVVSLDFRSAPLELIGALHLETSERLQKVTAWKKELELDGLVYLSTCNRVEFIFSDLTYFCTGRLHRLLQSFELEPDQLSQIASSVKRFRGDEAMTHLLRVACGLDSMVLGEREVITQLREAFDFSTKHKLAGDQLRVAGRILVETAKRIFTGTSIGSKPVSVNSLGWQYMTQWNLSSESPVLMIGAGQTNRNVGRFMFDAGLRNVTVLNRTPHAAEVLAKDYGWKWGSMEDLTDQLMQGPQAIVICTGSSTPILDADQARALPDGSIRILDLGLPCDTSRAFRMRAETDVVDLDVLQTQIDANLSVRQAAVSACETHIEEALAQYQERLKQRQMEIAMKALPSTISAIRETALGEVFAQDLSKLDDDTRELIERIMTYMEKKYVSVPMKLAREAILDQLRQS
jgi:glutamyl-tRNA reductase